MTYTQAKECIRELGRERLEELINQYSTEVIEAAFACDIPVEDIAEAYQGKWNSDADFAREMEESLGTIPENFPLHIHIDWEATARDIMMDYVEDNGHYFRCF